MNQLEREECTSWKIDGWNIGGINQLEDWWLEEAAGRDGMNQLEWVE